jgi:hypothetical protein
LFRDRPLDLLGVLRVFRVLRVLIKYMRTRLRLVVLLNCIFLVYFTKSLFYEFFFFLFSFFFFVFVNLILLLVCKSFLELF